MTDYKRFIPVDRELEAKRKSLREAVLVGIAFVLLMGMVGCLERKDDARSERAALGESAAIREHLSPAALNDRQMWADYYAQRAGGMTCRNGR